MLTHPKVDTYPWHYHTETY